MTNNEAIAFIKFNEARNEKFSKLVNEAVFAQIQIRHSGESYDRTVELFRCDRNGNLLTDFIDDFTIDGIIKIGKTIYSAMSLESGIGNLEDLVVELIFDGGAKAHFIIENDCYISSFKEGWHGWDSGEDLSIDEIFQKEVETKYNYFKPSTAADAAKPVEDEEKYIIPRPHRIHQQQPKEVKKAIPRRKHA